MAVILHLAWRLLRARPGSSAATLVVLLCGCALVSASAVLAESGLRGAGEGAGEGAGTGVTEPASVSGHPWQAAVLGAQPWPAVSRPAARVRSC